ncbi:MAG: helix-hairpin-helix domain-containing protein [Desulforhopalus sp.]
METGRGVTGNEAIPARYSPFFFKEIPINSVNKDMLMTVDGIGPALADKIIDYRQRFGLFSTSTDLQNIQGIGPLRAARLSTALRFDEAP